jgi:hypothetical protein
MHKRYLFALAFFCVVGTVAAQAQQNPFIGTWKQDLAKSKYNPVSLKPKTGITINIQAAGSGTEVTTDGADVKGAPTHTEYTAATQDGKDYPLKGSADYDSVAVKMIDANTRMTANKKGNVVVRMLRGVVSKDGKTLTLDGVGYNAQSVAFHTVTVFHKQ